MKDIQKKKICMLGDFSVGKTSLIRRFVEGIYNDEYLSTIGVRISQKIVTAEKKSTKLLIWDLAGGDNYTLMTSGFLKGAHGIILVCDVTRRQSFNAFNVYSRQIKEIGINPRTILVANKIDLKNEVEISTDRLASTSEALGIPYLFTSAKTGEGVEKAFHMITELMLAPGEESSL